MIRRLMSRFNSDICYQNPCGAEKGFLSITEKGELYSCDCIKNSSFHLGSVKDMSNIEDICNHGSRTKLSYRRRWLKNNICKDCAIYGFCFGTCPGKSIAQTKKIHSVDTIECEINRYMYPVILQEYSKQKSSLLNYYYSLQ